MGLKDVVLCDRKGAIYEGREGLNPIKEEMAEITNQNCEKGPLSEVIKGADVFKRICSSYLHLIVDITCTHVQGAAENARESKNIVHLVRSW